MRKIVAGLVAAVLFVALANGDEKQNIEALPPHPLDAAFEKANNERAADNALLNNPLFQKAVKAALQAKADQEKRFRDNPKLKDASPAQKARQKFLEVLLNEDKKTEK